MVVRMAINALCVVAHPDDCVIFARPFIDHYSDWNWTILYLTYSPEEPRSIEMHSYWETRNILTLHLGYVDTYLDMENNQISFDEEQAARELKNVAGRYDLILTHNPDGDYGHIHHKFVSSCVSLFNKPVVYFANWQQQNLELRSNEDLILDNFPLHKDVIEGFQDRNLGRYLVTESAKGLINGQT